MRWDERVTLNGINGQLVIALHMLRRGDAESAEDSIIDALADLDPLIWGPGDREDLADMLSGRES